jgi:hypothetical protein
MPRQFMHAMKEQALVAAIQQYVSRMWSQRLMHVRSIGWPQVSSHCGTGLELCQGRDSCIGDLHAATNDVGRVRPPSTGRSHAAVRQIRRFPVAPPPEGSMMALFMAHPEFARASCRICGSRSRWDFSNPQRVDERQANPCHHRASGALSGNRPVAGHGEANAAAEGVADGVLRPVPAANDKR